jgi:hypothetical protein
MCPLRQVCRLCFELYSQFVQLEEAAAGFAEAVGIPPGTCSVELPGEHGNGHTPAPLIACIHSALFVVASLGG